MLVLLPEFVEILKIAEIPHWTDVDDLALHIGSLIVGSTPYKCRPFLGEIISGAVDADKLDYMPRDCFSAGLPMPVDIERLLQKLQAVPVPASSDIARAWSEFSRIAADQTIFLLAIDERGGIAAEELVVSRVLLYDKLYHHQKVRSLEGLAERALDLLIENEPAFRSPAIFLTMTDADFLDARWLVSTSDAVKRAEELVRRIRDRHEMVRALAFGPSMIESPVDDPIAWITLQPYVSRERTAETTTFISRVVEIAKSYLNTAGQATLADELTEDLILVDLPDPQGISQKTRFLVGNEKAGLQHYSEVARVDRWAEAYENDKSIGFIYSPPEQALAVHLAARRAAKEIAGITFHDRQITLTKLPPEDVLALNDVLRAREATLPPDVRLPAGWQQAAPFSGRGDIQRQYGDLITRLASRFQSYAAYDGSRVDGVSIENWLLQFPRDDIRFAITILENITFWTRQRLADAIKSYLETFPATTRVVQLVPLGGPTTSAQNFKYILNDITGLPYEIKVLDSLNDVVSEMPVLFCDDYVGSGGQSRTVFRQWLGVKEQPLNEHHVDRLTDETIVRLRSCSLHFFFAAGRRSGLQALLADVNELLVESSPVGWISKPSDYSCFRPAAHVFERPEDANHAEDIFRKAGRNALSNETDLADALKAERELGYGNCASLDVFYYNTPSQSLTALWMRSDMSPTAWAPLFARRRRAGQAQGHTLESATTDTNENALNSLVVDAPNAKLTRTS